MSRPVSFKVSKAYRTMSAAERKAHEIATALLVFVKSGSVNGRPQMRPVCLKAARTYPALVAEREELVAALAQVSFYASVNHGTKCKDYGEVADQVLRKFGHPTGKLIGVKL